MSGSGWQAICKEEELAGGVFVEFSLGEATRPTRGFVFRRGDRVCAYLNRCPHLGIELNWLPGRFLDIDGCFIQCATHGALFTPEDGHCIAGPCQGDALTPLPVQVKEGIVRVNPGKATP